MAVCQACGDRYGLLELDREAFFSSYCSSSCADRDSEPEEEDCEACRGNQHTSHTCNSRTFGGSGLGGAR